MKALQKPTRQQAFVMPSILFISLALAVIGMALLGYVGTLRVAVIQNLDLRIARDAAQSGFEYAREYFESNSSYAGHTAPTNCSNTNTALSPYTIQATSFCATFRVEVVASPTDAKSKQLKVTGLVYRKKGGTTVSTSATQRYVGNVGAPSYTTRYNLPAQTTGFWGLGLGADGNFYVAEFSGGRLGRYNPNNNDYTTVAASMPQTRLFNAQHSVVSPGPSNTIWYTLRNVNKVAFQNLTTNSYGEFTLPTAASQPLGITRGQDGNMWVAGYASNKIVRVTPAGVMTELSPPSVLQPTDLTIGANDNTIWYAASGSNRIGYVNTTTPTPTVGTSFAIPAGSNPRDVALGPDNNIWYTAPGTRKIGRITKTGTITEYSAGLPAGAEPYMIARGVGNVMWFTIANQGLIGRINTTNGAITTYPTVGASHIELGADGNMWFTMGGNHIGKVTDVGGNVTISGPYIVGTSQGPSDITLGPDGNMWQTQALSGTLGRTLPSGTINSYNLNQANLAPQDITTVNGDVWFASQVDGTFFKATPGSGTNAPTITPYQPLGANSTKHPTGLTKGPDGNIWFAEFGANRIGRINTTGGGLTEYVLPANSAPRCIRPGVGNNLWFTQENTNQIGRITTGGTITQFTLPNANSGPYCLTLGPDGNMWFTEDAGRIGKITPTGTITEYNLPGFSSGMARPAKIIVGPDNNLWFTNVWQNRIGRITTSGDIKEYTLPTGTAPFSLAVGPDNQIWYTGYLGNYIGRLIIQNPAIALTDQMKYVVFRGSDSDFDAVS